MKTASPLNELKPRGLLNESMSLQRFNLDLYAAPKGLENLVSNVWHVHWNLPNGEKYLQSNLPHPVQHIVLDPLRGSGLYGCSTKKFEYGILGKGQVIGLKLIPGMGRAFINHDISSITDRFLKLSSIVLNQAEELETGLIENMPLEELLKRFGHAIVQASGGVTQKMDDARMAVQLVETTKDIYRVSELSHRLGLEKRQLQRLFSTHVGVSPKWVIDRYRMFEALDILNSGGSVNLAELALDLKYTDQSHFSNRFTAITGISPSAYLRQ